MPITTRPTSLLLIVCATFGVACASEDEDPELQYEMTIEPPKPILDGYTADPPRRGGDALRRRAGIGAGAARTAVT